VPQDHDQATYAPKLRKEDGIIDWSQRAEALSQRIRGVTPWPGAVTTHEGKPLRIWRATSSSEASSGRPGWISRIEARGIHVETGEGTLLLLEVQPANGRRMPAAAYARGHSLRPADVLGR
jgi:methionyl-tRNA formyltransferase